MIRLTDLTNPSFSGHESFPFRYGWLKKGYDALKKDGEFFSRRDALIDLGVGKNMVASIRHWLEVLGLAKKGPKTRRGAYAYEPTELGKHLLDDDGWDPYLEDAGSLWLLHRQAVTNPDMATTWWWAFSRPSTMTLTRAGLVAEMASAASNQGWRANANTIRRDVDCFIRTYVPVAKNKATQEDALACPLSALGLLQPTFRRDEFLFNVGWQDSLPDAIFHWALGKYLEGTLEERPQGAKTVSIDRLLHDAAAPGRIFLLSEEALIARLAKISEATNGEWVYDETVGLRQLVIKGQVEPDSFLERYYTMSGDSPAEDAA